MKGSRFKVLNEYVFSSESVTTVKKKEVVLEEAMSLGRDHSFQYSTDKNLKLYIYDARINSLVTFKAFLESYSISIDVQYDEADTNEGKAPTNPKDFSINYKVKVNVPSISLEDAKLNDARITEVINITNGLRKISGDRLMAIANPHRVLLGNLIHNGSFKDGIVINSKKDVHNHALLCYFNKANYEANTEMGFFESDGALFPKSYSFDLDISLYLRGDWKIPGRPYRPIEGFSPSGAYRVGDVRTWPFGVDDLDSVGNNDYDHSSKYTNNTYSWINFAFGNKSVKFKPFIDSLSYSSEAEQYFDDDEDIYRTDPTGKSFKYSKHSISFSVPAASLEESIDNHKKIQGLMRMIVPDENNLETNRVLKLKFSNLISKKGLGGQDLTDGFKGVIKTLTYEPDLEMGFFEDRGMILAKVFKISVEIGSVFTEQVLYPPTRKSFYNYGRTIPSVIIDDAIENVTVNNPVLEYIEQESPADPIIKQTKTPPTAKEKRKIVRQKKKTENNPFDNEGEY